MSEEAALVALKKFFRFDDSWTSAAAWLRNNTQLNSLHMFSVNSEVCFVVVYRKTQSGKIVYATVEAQSLPTCPEELKFVHHELLLTLQDRCPSLRVEETIQGSGSPLHMQMAGPRTTGSQSQQDDPGAFHHSGFSQRSVVKSVHLEPFLTSVLASVSVAEADIPVFIREILKGMNSSNMKVTCQYQMAVPLVESSHRQMLAHYKLEAIPLQDNSWDIRVQHEMDSPESCQYPPALVQMDLGRHNEEPMVIKAWKAVNGTRGDAASMQLIDPDESQRQWKPPAGPPREPPLETKMWEPPSGLSPTVPNQSSYSGGWRSPMTIA